MALMLQLLIAWGAPERPSDLPDSAVWFAETNTVLLTAQKPAGASTMFRPDRPFTAVSLEHMDAVGERLQGTVMVDSVERDVSAQTDRTLWPESWLELRVHQLGDGGAWIEPRVAAGGRGEKALLEVEGVGPGFEGVFEGRTFQLGKRVRKGRIEMRWTGRSGVRSRLVQVAERTSPAFEGIKADIEPNHDGTWNLAFYPLDGWPLEVVQPPPPPPPPPSAREEAQEFLKKCAQRIEIHMLRRGLPDRLDEVLSSEEQMDPWGNPLVYEPGQGRRFRLLSLGADGRPGGQGEAADLTHPPPEP